MQDCALHNIYNNNIWPLTSNSDIDLWGTDLSKVRNKPVHQSEQFCKVISNSIYAKKKLCFAQALRKPILDIQTPTVTLTFEGIDVGHTRDTPSHHGEQFCKVIWNSMHAERSYAPHKLQTADLWPLNSICDLDHWGTDLGHACDTLPHHGEQLCQVI